MAFGAQQKELIREMVAEEVRRQLSGKGGQTMRSSIPAIRPIPLIQGIPPVPQQQSQQPQGHPAQSQPPHWQPQESPQTPSQPLPSGQPQAQQQEGAPGDQERLNRVAHVLGDTQVRISRALEGSLRQLHDLLIRVEVTAEKVRSILRRTEPSREETRPGGP